MSEGEKDQPEQVFGEDWLTGGVPPLPQIGANHGKEQREPKKPKPKPKPKPNKT